MSNPHNIEAAVHILAQAKEEVAELLKESPMLSIRVENTMGLLIRGINHANGFNIGSYEDSKESKQMSNFFGLDVEEIEKQDVSPVVEVTKSEKDMFMERIQTLYEGFLDRDDKEIVESVPKLDILGVARLADITVENPASQNITQTFVKSIKKAIQDKIDLVEQREAEKKKLNNDSPTEGTATGLNLKKETPKEPDPKANTEASK